MFAPIDQSADCGTPAPTPAPNAAEEEKAVLMGDEVLCAVATAQDFDTYSKTVDGITKKTYSSDGPLTYKWTANRGTFRGPTNGQTVIWIAPNDVLKPTRIVIKCTIDDPPGARVTAPDSGSRDDAPLVRKAIIRLKAPTVEFKGDELVSDTIRACAGGVDDHGQADFQYRAHTRLVEFSAKLDGAALPDAKFTLCFIDNKGHDYGDGREKKVARLHKTDEPFDAAHPLAVRGDNN